MDTLSHGLYGGVAFGRRSKKDYLTAFLFGMLPDLLSFGILFILGFLGVYSFGRDMSGPPDPSTIPAFVYVLYDITHSFVPYGAVFALLWLWGKKNFALLTLGWPLHILVDMPTHSYAFFPTPFLWPLSDVKIDGIPWSQPIIFIPNVLLLIALHIWWYVQRRKKGPDSIVTS